MLLTEWWSRFRGGRGAFSDGAQLPMHHSMCLGCGSDNPHGHRISARRRGDGVIADHIFDRRHMGAPGIAHGGAVMTVLDDMVGMLLFVIGEMAVTRKLDTEFFSPTLLDTRYEVQASLRSREGRKLRVSAEIRHPESRERVAAADGLFIAVDVGHFQAAQHPLAGPR